MNIKQITNPRTKNIKSYIDIDIIYEDGSIIPFTAMPNDKAGADLYEEANGGSYGEIKTTEESSHKWDGAKWVAPSKELMIADAEIEKSLRMTKAESAIALFVRAVRLDIASDEEKQKLIEWEKYSVLLNRVDTSGAPNIEWPDAP